MSPQPLKKNEHHGSVNLQYTHKSMIQTEEYLAYHCCEIRAYKFSLIIIYSTFLRRKKIRTGEKGEEIGKRKT